MRRFVLSFLYLYYISSLPVIFSSSAAGEETLIGIKGRDFIIIGADSSIRSSISLTSTNVDKIRVLTDPFPSIPYPSSIKNTDCQQVIVAAVAGDSADADKLLGLLAAHALMVEFDSGLGCDIQCLLQQDKPTLEMGSRYLHSPAGLDAESLSYLARSEIASNLRSPHRYQVCFLIAGMVRCIRKSCKDDDYSPKNKRKNLESFAETIQHQVRTAVHLTTLDQNQQHMEPDFSSLELSNNVEEEEEEGLFLAPKLFWLDEYGSRSCLDYGAHGYGSNFALSIIDRVYRPDISRVEATGLIKDCFRQLRSRYIVNSPTSACIKCIDAEGCHTVL